MYYSIQAPKIFGVTERMQTVCTRPLLLLLKGPGDEASCLVTKVYFRQIAVYVMGVDDHRIG